MRNASTMRYVHAMHSVRQNGKLPEDVGLKLLISRRSCIAGPLSQVAFELDTHLTEKRSHMAVEIEHVFITEGRTEVLNMMKSAFSQINIVKNQNATSKHTCKKSVNAR